MTLGVRLVTLEWPDRLHKGRTGDIKGKGQVTLAEQTGDFKVERHVTLGGRGR